MQGLTTEAILSRTVYTKLSIGPLVRTKGGVSHSFIIAKIARRFTEENLGPIWPLVAGLATSSFGFQSYHHERSSHPVYPRQI